MAAQFFSKWRISSDLIHEATSIWLFILGLFLITTIAYGQSVLFTLEGTGIENKAQWEAYKPLLTGKILETIYGTMPEPPTWEAREIQSISLVENDIAYRYKEIEIQLYVEKAPTRTIRLAMFIPERPSGPVPVILALNKCGNAEVSWSQEISLFMDRTLHPACMELIVKQGGDTNAIRGSKEEFWSVETILKRGYAFATFHESDIAADVNSLDQGIFPYYPELTTDTGWHILSAWAWGLHRAVDYLVTDEAIDGERIIVFGHSRRGKAALLAAATDERIAMAVPHQSGTGGMAIGQARPLESLKRINTAFPFWFNGIYKTYSATPEKLPVDQYHVAALMAPRPIVETIGRRDFWSSYWLSWQNLKLITPVYELYGVPGISGKGKLSKRKRISGYTGNLLQIRRPYGHTMNADYWNCILDFADLQLRDD